MTNDSEAPHPYDPVEIDLRNPLLAAVLAWLWPGAGHLYQRRYGKGALLMVCILITYFFGFRHLESSPPGSILTSGGHDMSCRDHHARYFRRSYARVRDRLRPEKTILVVKEKIHAVDQRPL